MIILPPTFQYWRKNSADHSVPLRTPSDTYCRGLCLTALTQSPQPFPLQRRCFLHLPIRSLPLPFLLIAAYLFFSFFSPPSLPWFTLLSYCLLSNSIQSKDYLILSFSLLVYPIPFLFHVNPFYFPSIPPLPFPSLSLPFPSLLFYLLPLLSHPL